MDTQTLCVSPQKVKILEQGQQNPSFFLGQYDAMREVRVGSPFNFSFQRRIDCGPAMGVVVYWVHIFSLLSTFSTLPEEEPCSP